MNRLLLGACLACFIAANSGCCHPRSHWLGWKACGPGCGSCGGGCGEESCAPCNDCGSCNDCGAYDGSCPDCSACTPWGCKFGRPGGCGEFYWGDWCTGSPKCQTCDNCANWIGPDSPGGAGQPPNMYSKAHPYGNQVVGTKTLPPTGYSPQIVRHMSPKQYAPTRASQLAKRAAEKAGQPAPEVAQVAAHATPVENAAPTALSAQEGPGPVAQADARVPQAAPQMAQRVQAIEYNPQPQYTTHTVPNRYGPPQQIVRRQKENTFGPVPQTVSNPVPQRMAQQPPQRMAQQPTQRMMQQPPQRMSQQQMQMQQRAPQQIPQQAMRRGNQMQPQRAPQRGQSARTGNPGEFEGATVHLGTTDRVVTAEEAQALGAGPPPQMPPERIVSDPDHVADPTRRPVQNQPRPRR